MSEWTTQEAATHPSAARLFINMNHTNEPICMYLNIRRVGFSVYFYSTAVIIPVGLVCNLFSILVFLTAPRLRTTSTAHYLVALAAVDSLVLVADLLRWMTMTDPLGQSQTGIGFIHQSAFACKFASFWRFW